MDNLNYQIENSIDRRTIKVNSFIDCDRYESYEISSCHYKENQTIIILNLIDDVSNLSLELDKDYEIIVDESADEGLTFIIEVLEKLVILSVVITIIIIIVMIIQFNSDDNEVIKLLRCIGYSKYKLYVYNSLILYVLFSLIFFIIVLITFVLNLLLLNVLKYRVILFNFFIVYFIISVSIFLTYYILYFGLNSKSIR